MARGTKKAKASVTKKAIEKEVKKYDATKKVNKEINKVKNVMSKVHNKVPFTFKFMANSKHHKKHHTPEKPTFDGQQILVGRSEYNWCSKYAKMVIKLEHGNKYLDKALYRAVYDNLISHFILEKHYQKYLLAKNRQDMLEGGLLAHTHHESKLQREEGEEARMEKHELEANIKAMANIEEGVLFA